jgi:hypothetical protein
MCGFTAAHAAAVVFGTEDFSVHLGLLLRAGHYYEFVDVEERKLDDSAFSLADAEFETYGDVGGRVSYDLRIEYPGSVREAAVGVEPASGFSATVGRQFVPFGVEATTPEGYLTCSSRTVSSNLIAPGREYGLRLDYERPRDDWPYEFGAAAGVYNGASGSYKPLVAGAGRVYGTPAPGLRTFTAGCSFYYRKEERFIIIPPYVEGPYFFPAPRLGFDARYELGPLQLAAEYMQYFVQQEIIGAAPIWRVYIYKDDYYRGHFATLTYARPLPYEYLSSVRPYLRYERFKPGIFRRGDIRADYYTGGFSVYFYGQIVMFRADYTRIIEAKNRTANDRIASEFQVLF